MGQQTWESTMEREELEKRLTFAGFNKFRKVSGESSVTGMFAGTEATGIYVLCFKEGDYNVGKATNVVERFRSHAKEKCKIEAIAFKTIKPEELTATERKTIAALVSMDVPLRNITDTPDPNGRVIKLSKGNIITKEIRQKWFADVHWNDLIGTPMNDDVRRGKYTKKFLDLKTHEHADEVFGAFAKYLTRCMPLPRQTSYRYWHISCLAMGNLASISTNFQWVAVCTDYDEGIYFMLLARATILRKKYGHNLEAFDKKYGVETHETSFTAGGTDQVAIDVPLSKMAELLDDDVLVDAIRDLNMDLMLRGGSPFKQYHCFDLADAIFTKI